MSEVKPSDIELVVDAYKQWIAWFEKAQRLNLRDFKRYMEPHFKRAGYRDVELGRQNILLLTDGPVGDFILTSPAIREVRRIYPQAHISLMVDPPNVNFAENCPYVDEIIIRARKPEPDFRQDALDIMPQLLRRRYDVVYSFKHFSDTLWLMYLSGARERVIFSFFSANENEKEGKLSKYFDQLATNVLPVRRFGYHVLDCFLSVIDGTLHAPVANRELEIWYTPKDFNVAKSFVGDLPRPLYALAMGARNAKRRYPPEKFAQLLKMILNEEPTAHFVILGGGESEVKSAQILKENLGEEIFEKHVLNLVNKTTFRESSVVSKFCDMYIGNNTGNMWGACTFKCPVLVAECFPKDLDTGVEDVPRLFGPYHVPAVSVQPEHALPECAENKPYYLYGCRADEPHCITQIEPATLFRGFKLLKEKIAKKIVDTTYIS